MLRLALILLTLAACTALAQDQNGEVEIVLIPKAQLAALLQRLARQYARIEKLESDKREATVMLGCT